MPLAVEDVKDAISLPELAGFLESVGISTDDVWTETPWSQDHRFKIIDAFGLLQSSCWRQDFLHATGPGQEREYRSG